MFIKLLFLLGFLSAVWGDEYHPSPDQNHSSNRNHNRPVRDPYHPIRNHHHSLRDHYHPHEPNHQTNEPQKDNYHPHTLQRVDQKIIGGVQTTIENLPYQTSLRYITSHSCGAAILDERTAITAAHCVYGRRPSSLSLMSGTTFISDNTHPGKLSFVSKVIIHEDYNTTSQDNDIAILKLYMPLQLTDKIKPIALQEEGEAVKPGTLAVVSGWGRTEESKPNPTGPFALRKATVSVLSKSECEVSYSGNLTSTMICAQTQGRDACQGDSGGPLVSNNKLIGVVSWGYGCARPKYPGVYTSISALRSWINKHRN